MQLSLKKVLWIIALLAGITVLSVALVGQPAKAGTLAVVPGDNPAPTPLACANTACNDACWIDGTHPNAGTFAKQTIPTPAGCEGTGGCLTKPCQ